MWSIFPHCLSCDFLVRQDPCPSFDANISMEDLFVKIYFRLLLGGKTTYSLIGPLCKRHAKPAVGGKIFARRLWKAKWGGKRVDYWR